MRSVFGNHIERIRSSAERPSLSEWMETHVVIPNRYLRPGPLALEDWQREPIDAMLDPDVRVLALMWYSQSLKTTSVNCRIAWGIMEADEQTLLLAPTRQVLRRFVNLKFDEFMTFVPGLSARMWKNRRGGTYWEDGLYTIEGRQVVAFGTSRSISGMKSISANLVVFDEYDDGQVQSADSGTPFDLVIQRGQQVMNPLAIFESTPSQQGESLIDEAFRMTAAMERYCGCIECGEGFLLELEVVHLLDETWRIVCPACGYVYSEEDRQELITDERSRWIATNDDAPAGYLGYHINQFHSAAMSVDATMQTYREDNRHGFTTQVLARPYQREEIPQLDPNDLLDLHGPRPTGLPLLARTAGVDSQFGRNARFECTITEWFGDRALPVPYSWHLVITVDGEDWRGAVRQLGKVAASCDVMGVDVGSNEGGDKIKTLLRTQLPALFRRGRVKAIKGIGTQDWESAEVIQGGRRFRDGKAFDATISVYSEVARLVALHYMASKTLVLKDAVSEFPAGYHAQLASHWVDKVVSPTGVERLRFRQKAGVRDDQLDSWMYSYAMFRFLPLDYKTIAGSKRDVGGVMEMLGL